MSAAIEITPPTGHGGADVVEAQTTCAARTTSRPPGRAFSDPTSPDLFAECQSVPGNRLGREHRTWASRFTHRPVFFRQAAKEAASTFLSVVTVGELRRGVQLIRLHGDLGQADRLAHWLDQLLIEYCEDVLEIDTEKAHLWGRSRVPCSETALDKPIATTALIYDLTVVTRNHRDSASTGVRLLNPFST